MIGSLASGEVMSAQATLQSSGLIKFINHGRSHAIRRDREEFCLNFANNCWEAVQQKAPGLRTLKCPEQRLAGVVFWDVYLDCEFFLGRDLCLLHNKVVFTEFDPNLCTNDDTSLQLYNLTALERQALNFYRDF